MLLSADRSGDRSTLAGIGDSLHLALLWRYHAWSFVCAAACPGDRRHSYGWISGYHQPREKKLEILKDSHAGAFAIIMGCSYFVLALGVWSEMDLKALPVAGLIFVVSRTLSSLALSTFPKANKSGSLSMFSDAAQKRILLITLALWLIVCAGVGICLDWKQTLLLFVTAAVVYGSYYRLAMKQFGGTTGDIAGFFTQICELACAFVIMLGGKLL